MTIYKVIISFMREHSHHMYERGVLAMNPGEALNLAIQTQNIRLEHVHSFKSFVNCPESLDEFGRDAMILTCIGTSHNVIDIWKRKHGE